VGPYRRLAAVAVAIGAVVAPAGADAARHRRTPKPDLKITLLEAALGRPARAVVGTDGVAEPITVQVTTKNQGNATAGPSITNLFIQDSSHHHHQKKIRIRRLKPHTRVDSTVEITGAKPTLGFAQIGAVADFDKKVKESDEGNNLARGERFSVLAKRWNVSDFQTIMNATFTKSVTVNGSGFHFELLGYDHAAGEWLYYAYGPITDLQSQTNVCSYSGSKTVNYGPWLNSYLRISRDLGGYSAMVKASALPSYPINVTCLGVGAYTYHASFSDLRTFIGEHFQPTMSPKDTKLSDSWTDAALHTTWKWDFAAAIR
jgi:CARDB